MSETDPIREKKARAAAWAERMAPSIASKLAPVYEALSWHFEVDGVRIIPDRDALIELITRLSRVLEEDGYKECSSGGIAVGWNGGDEDGWPFISFRWDEETFDCKDGYHTKEEDDQA